MEDAQAATEQEQGIEMIVKIPSMNKERREEGSADVTTRCSPIASLEEGKKSNNYR